MRTARCFKARWERTHGLQRGCDWLCRCFQVQLWNDWWIHVDPFLSGILPGLQAWGGSMRCEQCLSSLDIFTTCIVSFIFLWDPTAKISRHCRTFCGMLWKIHWAQSASLTSSECLKNGPDSSKYVSSIIHVGNGFSRILPWLSTGKLWLAASNW